MRRGKVCATAALVAGLAFAGEAGAQTLKPRDNALNPTKPGNDIMFDTLFIGAQLSYENRTDLEPGMSQIKSRVSTLVTTPFFDGSLNLDISVFLYNFGVSVGFKDVWRTHQGIDPSCAALPNTTDTQCASNRANTRDRRVFQEEAKTDQDFANIFKHQTYPYLEGRFQFAFPLGESWTPRRLTAPLLFLNRTFVRWEDRANATFDWLHMTPHDGGVFFKYEGTMFYRHRDFGGIGPSVRYMNLRRSEPVPDGAGGFGRRSKRAHEIAYGFTLASNVGWRAGSDDVLLFQIMADIGDNKAGTHSFQELFGGEWPLQVLLVYRTVLNL